MTGRRALVAGGAGFIGGNLCAALLARGDSVVCVDNLVTGREANAARLAHVPGFAFIRGDITDPALIARIGAERYDDVYNLACPTGVPNIARLGMEMLLTSSSGSLNLLEIARTSAARYLFTSTAEVYGEATEVPQREDYNGNVDPVGPRSPYEEGKRYGEALAMQYSRQHGVNVRIIRVFNTYGAGMSPADDRVIPRLIRAAIDDTAFPIYGDGSQTRSFLHVDDLIDGLFLALDRGQSGDVFNIGSSDERTICSLHAEAEDALGKRIAVARRPHFIRDHLRRCPDTSRIAALGWRARISLREGLRRSYRDLGGIAMRVAIPPSGVAEMVTAAG